MFHRIIVFFLSIAALTALSAPAALAQPPATIGQVPPGFPTELKQYVGGTKEFLDAPWFHQDCKNRGGDVGQYINAVMFQEPRLLYWSTPPEARKAFWTTDPLNIPENIDVNTEPPNLPKTFPAVAVDGRAYTVRSGGRYCADDLKQWTNPANNAWGFTWVSAPDAESLEAMKKHPGSHLKDTIDKFTNACGEGNAPYCQKAFFLDCSRTAMNPEKKQDCIGWNLNVAQLFTGITEFIDDNTSWLQKIGQFFGIVGEVNWIGGRIIVEAFTGILNIVVGVVKFIADPVDAIDDMANSLHRSAVDFTTKILQGLAGIGNFDPSSPWFLRTYAASTGLGIVVMAFMAILMIARTASGGGGREDLQEALFKQLPLGVFLAVFAPAIGAVLGETVNGLTNGIAAWDAEFLTGAVNKLAMLGSVTSALIPGGAFIGLLLFLLMVIGALAVFVGLAMQSIALPLSAVVAGLAWGMWVHPTWRRKALKVPLTYLGILFSKPLLFFLLGVIFALIDGNLSEPAIKAGGIPLLTQIVLVIVALIVSGFAPFSLLKYAPLLPTAADSHDSQPSPGFGTSAAVGAVMNGAGRGGGSGGGAGPPASTGGGGGGHSIQQSYSQRQNKPNEQPRPRTSSPVTAGAKGSGGKAGQQQVGKAAATSGGTTGAATGAATAGRTAATAGKAAATVGTGVATGGVSLAAQAGAQIGAAAINKTRQAAHNRHLPELDHDTTKNGETT